MKDILEQVIQIDSDAFEEKKKNEEILTNKKQEYEKKIEEYRIQILNDASCDAKKIYSEIIDKEKKEVMRQEEQIKRMSDRIEKKYKRVETEVIEKIFNKLFVMGG